MEIQLGALAALLGGELTDPARGEDMVDNVRPLDRAGPRDLAFLWDPAFAEVAPESQAGCIISKEPVPGKTCMLVADPQKAMLVLLGQVHALRHPAPAAGVHPAAWVDPSATIGEGASVGPNATVEAGSNVGARTQVRGNAYVGRSVTLGEDCVVHPNATILDHVTVGDRTVIWSGAVVGKDGFGFVPRSGDRRDLSQGSTRIPQIGGVRIGEEVEVGALTTVDRGALEDTVVEDRVIVDSQVHIAHGCHVGKNTVMIGRTALAGGVEIGENVYMLQASAVGQGRKVGAKALVGSGAQVLYHDVGEGEEVLGWPSKPAMRERRLQVILGKLSDEWPKLRRRVKKLEKAAE
jgi:UDP-3-O-[3-hydroxymyristoyl] glucosamine N-acyltransferase